MATGIAQCGSDLVTILDFEKIVAEIAPETSIQMSEIDQLGPRERDSRAILIAEDSILLSKMIRESLNKAGYTNLSMFGNGRDLWEHLLDIKQRHRIDEEAALIITEEMRIKGKELGANEQMSKPEIGHLVSVMDNLLARS